MIYSKTFWVPPDKSPYEPETFEITIKERFLTRIDIMMDAVATKGLVGIKIIVGNPNYNLFYYPLNPTEWVRKSDTWIGRFDLTETYLTAKILACSRLEKDGIWIGAQKEHWVSITIHTSQT